jgi:putative endonuclease
VNQELGWLGEEMARHFLAACGYHCLAQRFRVREGEIDLVVRAGDVLIFVEVKTRRGHGCGRPEESVTRVKLTRLRRLAAIFLDTRPDLATGFVRFDVVAVEILGEGRGCRLRHLAGIGG